MICQLLKVISRLACRYRHEALVVEDAVHGLVAVKAAGKVNVAQSCLSDIEK